MAMSMWHKPFFLYFSPNKGLERVGIADTIANLIVCLRQMMDTHHLPPRRDSEAEQVPSTAPKHRVYARCFLLKDFVLSAPRYACEPILCGWRSFLCASTTSRYYAHSVLYKSLQLHQNTEFALGVFCCLFDYNTCRTKNLR